MSDSELYGAKDRQWLAACDALATIFARCKRSNYFAIIVDRRGRIVGSGYNGAPAGMTNCTDGGCPHADEPPMTYNEPCVAIHCEENSLMYSDYRDREGATLYVNGIPCFSCAKKLAGSGIARVVYRMGARDHAGSSDGLHVLMLAGISVREYD